MNEQSQLDGMFSDVIGQDLRNGLILVFAYSQTVCFKFLQNRIILQG